MRYALLILCFSLPVYSRTRIAGEWILKFKAPSRNNSWESVRTRMLTHYNFIHSFGPEKRYALFQFNGKKNSGVFKLPPEVTAQPNYFYSALEVDPGYEKQWGLKNTGQSIGDSGVGTPGFDVDAEKAWQLFTGKSQTMIAVLDTGIDLKHLDLQKNLWKNKREITGNLIDDDGNGFIDDVNGWNFVDQNNNVQDGNHHGTFVSGIIGAETGNGIGIQGVLKEVSILPVKILDEDGNGTTERAIAGIEYAVKNGAKIINASWGGRSYDQALYESVRWANEYGVLFVTASGNNGADNDNDSLPVYPASFKLPNVITVLSINNKGDRSPTSNYGKSTAHLAAPGVQIYSTYLDNSYQFLNGTSYAAPFVSAALALLKGFAPELTMAELKTRVIESTTPLHYYVRNESQSGGRLNLYNMLKNIKPPRLKEPSVWKKVNWERSTSHPYSNLDEIKWTVNHPGATHIRIHVKKLQTETGYDTLALKDKQGVSIGSYSGDLGDFISSDVLGDTLDLSFVSDYVKTGYGIDIDYYEYSVE